MTAGPYDFFADSVDTFERTVVQQEPVEAEHYDEAYFAEAWRDAGNRYDLDTRRRVEARNPELIRDVFEPSRVLDVGCGPGFLMALLDELGVHADGVDFSPSSVVLAPENVRKRIGVSPVTELAVASGAYDLVICREVLEHLTVLQVRRTVAEMCRVTSRFVYVTTRFHPAPANLLDVTTDFETDPTHVSLLTKDFVRVLFVLEGLVSRPDLEARLDWAGKGRVLVYERRPVP